MTEKTITKSLKKFVHLAASALNPANRSTSNYEVQQKLKQLNKEDQNHPKSR
ncbi:hypothetical protein HCA00_01090 [Listeria booriae]|uniref:hypothetical protein n=1 Tax=Listeria booriae TaxID=1552123 RepID=UPI001624819A|nr:hypothetical protein [Listeria booriae]MBC1336266.1 hypothetical protein [Listeria booriae]MBC1945612.1 hypothetical protein [Listeria booriae]MBC6127397.1 hypothetical protein [Listeria booriae]MBC6164017.1 hypothetical protein [Listeria booriae]